MKEDIECVECDGWVCNECAEIYNGNYYCEKCVKDIKSDDEGEEDKDKSS